MQLVSSSALADGANILVNGDFEAQGIAWSYPGQWLLDATQARGGEGCLSGEVDGPNQSLTARQTITLQPNKAYTFRLSARGTPGTKVAVLIQRGSELRRLAQFVPIRSEWTPLDAGFFSEQGGDWELRLVQEVVPEARYREPKGGGRPRIDEILEKGKPIVVQIERDPEGQKGANLTTNLSFAGRYLVLTPFDSTRGVSRKVEDEETRASLRELAAKPSCPMAAASSCAPTRSTRRRPSSTATWPRSSRSGSGCSRRR